MKDGEARVQITVLREELARQREQLTACQKAVIELAVNVMKLAAVGDQISERSQTLAADIKEMSDHIEAFIRRQEGGWHK